LPPSELPKTARAEACVSTPEVIAGQIDVLPADRRQLGEQRIAISAVNMGM